MRRAFLHVGHSKTGSSFVQAVLARNAEILRARGYNYPRGGNFRAAQNFEISAGNYRFSDITADPARFEALTNDDRDIVLSSEYLFHEIAESEAPLRYFKDRGYEVHVLVFTRNPVAHILSGYSQAVKREGFHGTVDAFIASRDDRIQHPFELVPFIAHCDGAGAQLTLESYDRTRARILDVLLDFLGTDADGIEVPDRVVNRSLSRAELEIVRMISDLFGQRVAQGIADELCNSLPAIRSETTYPDAKTMARFIANMAPAVARVEALCAGRYEPYEVDFDEEARKAAAHQVGQIAMPSRAQTEIIRELLVANVPAAPFARLKTRAVVDQLRRRFARR